MIDQIISKHPIFKVNTKKLTKDSISFLILQLKRPNFNV